MIKEWIYIIFDFLILLGMGFTVAVHVASENSMMLMMDVIVVIVIFMILVDDINKLLRKWRDNPPNTS